jgi:hypothetical protein
MQNGYNAAYPNVLVTLEVMGNNVYYTMAEGN